ncbi:rhomboid family protein [Filimonas lacunae]|nr:rhomboid family protein [Filimonas lacunae]
MEQGKRSKMLLGEDNNALTWLIIVNAAVFVVLLFTRIVYLLSYDNGQDALFNAQIFSWLALPASTSQLLTHPWTIFTYMFTHVDVWKVIGSLLWLWAFGYMLQDLSGNKRLVPVYLYGGIAGAVFFVVSANLLPGLHHTGSLSGAVPSLMAIAVAATTLAPRFRLFTMINGGIPLWIVMVVFVIIDITGIAKEGLAVALSHVGGAFIGFIYAWQLKKGNDWGEWMYNLVDKVDGLFNPEKKYNKKSSAQKHFYKASRTPFEKRSNITPQRVDDLLDKINSNGYNSLTDEEKEFLKRASEQQN